ncbi:hypothetical protein [Clostridium sp. DJ247]|uniref:hypothetical protein n=1 Tax=Clostridium sp. DJ247 TaxID=2726188 RepID=UPI0016277278|nr:hypothetical protein [Clostridium sp. DJ247]MBC2579775.1 hypothetical protein [Clostridium sp. DJ247]
MPRKKEKIKVEIINPEALEQASINKTKVLIDIFWDKFTENSGWLKNLAENSEFNDNC